MEEDEKKEESKVCFWCGGVCEKCNGTGMEPDVPPTLIVTVYGTRRWSRLVCTECGGSGEARDGIEHVAVLGED